MDAISATQMIFDRYLRLLNVERQQPTHAYLRELVAAQVTRIPFENVSKLYYLKRENLRFIPDLEKYLSGIERFRFGGTCYSNNYHFYSLLRHLGFQATLCGADMNMPSAHFVVMVTTEGRDFLIDTGYAAPFLEPMPHDLDEDYEVRLGRDRYVLRPNDGDGSSRMDLYRDGKPIHGYTARPTPRQISDLSPVIVSSFRDDSVFMNSLLLARFWEGRSLVVYNLSVIESEGESFSVRTLSNREELPAVVEEHFGIPGAIVSDAVSMLGDLGNAWS